MLLDSNRIGLLLRYSGVGLAGSLVLDCESVDELWDEEEDED